MWYHWVDLFMCLAVLRGVLPFIWRRAQSGLFRPKLTQGEIDDRFVMVFWTSYVVIRLMFIALDELGLFELLGLS